MIFDTHAHYNDKQYEEDRDHVLMSLKEAGVQYAVNVCADWKSVEETKKMIAQYPFLYGAVGLHPDCVGELNNDRLEEIRQTCHLDKVVAIGEIGLDYHWMVQPKEIQQEWFVRQLDLAKEEELPVIIHSRDAAQDTFDLIKKEHAGTTGGVIHCFSGSVEMAKEYVKLGYKLGIGGVVTFKNSKSLKRVVEEISLESLVLETDCPYLAPVPYRGKRNSSAYLPYVVEEIAALKQISKEEVEEVTFRNALELFRLDQ